ncbi:MAG TPA: 5-(carboxyamino)imidazole ribonucleotide mutase [bacterium]|nr:5-(carboxyamino)imidazole ribonucleotide mutase [bacterium]
MSKPEVAVVMGSKSDMAVMGEAARMLDHFGVSHEVLVMSAHRSPAKTRQFAAKAKERGIKVIIAGAGMAAHLPGVIASETILPVIGVPLPRSALGGLDSLHSIVQMPTGVPVATMAIGEAGAANAAILAAQILALADARLAARLRSYKRALAR